MTHIEQAIREMRLRVKSSGASYRLVARLAGLTDRTVRHFVAEIGVPSTETVTRIERALAALKAGVPGEKASSSSPRATP